MKRIATYLLLISAVAVCSCSTLPSPPLVPDVYSLPPASVGTLSEITSRVTANLEQGQSGFLPLTENEEAMKWRLALVDLSLIHI